MFEKVSDVMAMKTLPKVMKALEAYKGSSPESSVEANELLIVKSVKSKKLKGKVLKVYSPRLKKKKELPEGCCGKFSTKPYDVRMFLPEIEELLADSFPLQFMLYVNSDTVGEIPSSIVSNAVNLRRFEMETSLIASVFFFNEEQYEDGAPKLVEVPFDLDIEVQAMADCRDSEQLVQDTLEVRGGCGLCMCMCMCMCMFVCMCMYMYIANSSRDDKLSERVKKSRGKKRGPAGD